MSVMDKRAGKSFHMLVRKRRQKGFRVSNFALLLVSFKLHYGSKGVKSINKHNNKGRVDHSNSHLASDGTIGEENLSV